MRLLLFTLSLMIGGVAISAPFPKIEVITIGGNLVTTRPEEILLVLPIKRGDPFNPAKLDQSKEILEKWGIFKSIDLTTQKNGTDLNIHVQLDEAAIIGTIDIAGNYPYIEGKIRKRLNLAVGDIYTQNKIEEQVERIKTFYDRMGYFNTTVNVKTKPLYAKNSLQVTFHIVKGERLRYRKVEFLGAKSFLTSRFHSFTSINDLYSPQRLKKTIKDISRFYQRRGFVHVKVQILKEEIDTKASKVDLTIGIQEGPRVQVLFLGDSPYRVSTLKKTITLYEERNFDAVELQLSAKALTKKLKEDGYDDCKVTYSTSRTNEKLFQVIFHIKAGFQRHIAKIHFKGNEKVGSGELQKQIFTKKQTITQKGLLNLEMLSLDQRILKQYYESRGYPDVKVGQPLLDFNKNKTRYTLTYPIEEGPFVPIGSLTFEGNHHLAVKVFHKILVSQTGTHFSQIYLESDLEQLHLLYADHGYPYAKIEQQITHHEDHVDIHYLVHEGQLVRIGEIIHVGDILTSMKAIRQAMRMQPGDIYSRKKIIEAQLKLRRLGAFNDVQVEAIGLEHEEPIVHLKVKVEERHPFSTDIEAAYSTDTQYSGSIKFTNSNSFGWGKTTRYTLVAGIERDRLEISWIDPLFLGSNWRFSTSSYFDYTVDPLLTSFEAGGNTNFFLQKRKWGYLVGYRLQREYVFEGKADNPNALRDSTTSKILGSISYDSRDNYGDPRRGFFGITGLSLLNEIGGEEANYIKMRLGSAHYYPIVRWLTLSNAFRVDRIDNFGDNVVIQQSERLVLGGDDTIRGFKEDRVGPLDADGNPKGGRFRLIYNGELHFHVVPAFQFALFYDAGSLTDTVRELGRISIRHSTGFGFRYVTPVGPIRADYGIVLDPQSGDPFGRFHLTFGYPF